MGGALVGEEAAWRHHLERAGGHPQAGVGPEVVEGRRVVTDLYSRFPDSEDGKRSRLRSRDDTCLFGALDELLVHDLLASQYRVSSGRSVPIQTAIRRTHAMTDPRTLTAPRRTSH